MLTFFHEINLPNLRLTPKQIILRIFVLVFISFLIMSCGTQKRTKTAAPAPVETVKTEEKAPEKTPEEIKLKEPVKEEFCARNTKMQGYRIQIYFSKDRAQWEPTEKSFRAKNPGTDVLLKYSAPHYRILVGQYLTKNSAQADLIKYRRDYPNAVIANWDIWCKSAK